jgi:hypothetical protein
MRLMIFNGGRPQRCVSCAFSRYVSQSVSLELSNATDTRLFAEVVQRLSFPSKSPAHYKSRSSSLIIMASVLMRNVANASVAPGLFWLRISGLRLIRKRDGKLRSATRQCTQHEQVEERVTTGHAFCLSLPELSTWVARFTRGLESDRSVGSQTGRETLWFSEFHI